MAYPFQLTTLCAGFFPFPHLLGDNFCILEETNRDKAVSWKFYCQSLVTEDVFTVLKRERLLRAFVFLGDPFFKVIHSFAGVGLNVVYRAGRIPQSEYQAVSGQNQKYGKFRYRILQPTSGETHLTRQSSMLSQAHTNFSEDLLNSC